MYYTCVYIVATKLCFNYFFLYLYNWWLVWLTIYIIFTFVTEMFLATYEAFTMYFSTLT